MDWKGIATLLLEALGKSALSRFFIIRSLIGAGLLGFGWPEVVASALETAFRQPPGTAALWTPISGVSLIVFGIAGRLDDACARIKARGEAARHVSHRADS